VVIETLIKDALLSKNCVVKVFVEENQDVEKERYEGLEPMELLQALQPTQPNQLVDITEFNEKTGSAKLTRTTTHRKLIVSPVPPENFEITSDHKSIFLEDCTYCKERKWVTRSDLIEMGFSRQKVNSLPASTSDTKIDSVERNQIQDEQLFQNNHRSMQVVEVDEHYIRIDRDGDGVAELVKCLSVENIVLSVDDAPCVPFAAGTAFIMGHRFYGLSLYDLLKNIQDTKTHFLRQWIDNALANNHNKTKIVEDRVTMDDFVDGRPNALLRVDGMDACEVIPTNDISGSCSAALAYQDKLRSERMGSALDLQTNQTRMPHNIGDQGVHTLIDNLEQITALMVKNLSETVVRGMYLLVHKMYKMHFDQEVSGRSAGGYQTTNPSQWQDREKVNLTVGLTKGERVQQQIALEKIIVQQQGFISQGEGVLADKGGLYSALLDHARMSGIDNPEKYWINPSSPQSQQTQQQQQQMAQQGQQKADQLQQMQFQQQQQLVDSQVMEVNRNLKNDVEELQFKYEELYQKLKMDKYETDADSESKEAGLIATSTVALELESLKQIKGAVGGNR
jgi:hypothetical protein